MKIEKTIIKQLSDLDKAKDKWINLQDGIDMTVFQSFEWNKLLFREWENDRVSKHTSEIVIYSMFIDSNECILIAPMLIQKTKTKNKYFGRDKGIYILGHDSYSDYLNFIYKDVDNSVFKLVIDKIKNDYKDYCIYFTDIRENTLLAKYADSNMEPNGENISVSVKKEESIEEYLKLLTKHTKQNLRTAGNRMDRDNVKYEMKVYGQINDKKLINDLLNVHINRMKSKNTNNSDFIHSLSTKVRIHIKEKKERNNNIVMESMQTMDNSFLLVVYLNSNIAGYLYGLYDKGIVRIMQNCFSEDHKFYSPLFKGAYDYIVESYKDPSIREIDFTRGNEEYKYKLGGKETILKNYKG